MNRCVCVQRCTVAPARRRSSEHGSIDVPYPVCACVRESLAIRTNVRLVVWLCVGMTLCTCAHRFQGRCMSNYMVRLLADWLLYKRREKMLRQTYIRFAKHDHRSSLSCAFQR